MKLTKSQRENLDKIIEALDQAHSDANDLWAELEAAVADKSEKWQESEKGQEYQEALTALEDWTSEIESIAQSAPDFAS